jgi:hypothetical protein
MSKENGMLRPLFICALVMGAFAGNVAAAPVHHNRSPHAPRSDGWYPHVSTELPFGSRRWWDQKESEGSAGRP